MDSFPLSGLAVSQPSESANQGDIGVLAALGLPDCGSGRERSAKLDLEMRWSAGSDGQGYCYSRNLVSALSQRDGLPYRSNEAEDGSVHCPLLVSTEPYWQQNMNTLKQHP